MVPTTNRSVAAETLSVPPKARPIEPCAEATATRPVATRGRRKFRAPLDQHVTLLELVEAVTSVTDDDREAVATVLHMLHSGTVTLCGSFRGTPISEFRIAEIEPH